MAINRLKHSFSSGEMSPLMNARLDFSRYKNGCSKLSNMVCTTQGPSSRRPGFRFIYDLMKLGLDENDLRVREIPFVFNEYQAYALIFFVDTAGDVILVFGDGLGLITYGTTEVVECPPAPIAQPAFTGAGDYTFTYDITSAADISIKQTSAAGVEVSLANPADYTIALDTPTPGTHTVTVTSALTADGTLDIYHRVSKTAGDILILNLGPVISPTHTEGDMDPGWDIEHFDWAQSGDEIYIAQSGQQPSIIRRWGLDCWELVSLTFTDQPTEWSDEYGWPERVTFHQQRLAYAANILRRQTVWMSRAGDFKHFGALDSGASVDADALAFTLDSGTQNKIVWMLSGKALNVGTIGNEWTVTGSTRTSLTPSNILAQRQTNNGSEPDKRPLLVGITTLFIERHGRVINEFVYDYTYDSYKTSDMSILSNHLTQHSSIVDWTYQQTPDNVIWSIRDDGAILGITYQREHEVIGWHQHHTEGAFRAITSVPGDTREDEVWTVVERVVGGATKMYIEKMTTQFQSESAVDARFLDCFVEYIGPPARVMTGLDHLEGVAVSIIADGTVHPELTVVNGQVELNKDYSNVAIGVNFTSEIWPNLSDVATSTGTTFGRMQRITQLDIDFYNSLGGYMGRYDIEDGETVEELAFRVPADLTGQAVPMYTGIYAADFLEGFDRKAVYFFRQTQPLPMTIRGITDAIEVQE